jgi:predicted DNA-binding transcriptional regulator YafY
VAVLRASPLGLRRLRDEGAFAARAVREAAPPDSEGWRRLALPVEGLDQAALLVMGLGPEAEVLEPPELREHVRLLARQVAALAR